MAGTSLTKLKLLKLRDFLLYQTDENHPATMAEILAYLEEQGIPCERKALYNDMENLRTYGLDILTTRDTTTRYYVGARDFELAEVKLLADAVQSSKFITQKKTRTLIDKLTRLTSVHEAQTLKQKLIIHNRIKTMNESVYYSVDQLSQAIAGDCVIHFQYYRYNHRKQRVFRHDGQIYEVSPFALIWDNEKYYLLAYDHADRKMKHFRADKMAGITILEDHRQGKEEFRNYDMSVYTSRVFSMFGGDSMRVRIRFPDAMLDPVIDQFGMDVEISNEGDGHFLADVNVEVSPQFYAWLFGLGKGIEILSPPEAVEGMKKQLQEVLQGYTGKEEKQ